MGCASCCSSAFEHLCLSTGKKRFPGKEPKCSCTWRPCPCCRVPTTLSPPSEQLHAGHWENEVPSLPSRAHAGGALSEQAGQAGARPQAWTGIATSQAVRVRRRWARRAGWREHWEARGRWGGLARTCSKGLGGTVEAEGGERDSP